MKTPRLLELKRLNRTLAETKRSRYRRFLGLAIVQYSRLTGDRRLLGYLRAKRYDLLFAGADALSGQLYTDAATHFAAHQVAALIRKYPWDPAEVRLDPEATAVRAFLASEHRCKWVNRKMLALYRRNADNTDPLIRRMKAFVRYVLGTKPDLGQIYELCDFTAGASIGVHGNATNLQRKLLAKSWSVSPSALPYFAAALCHHPHYAVRVAKGNGRQQSLYVSDDDVRESCELVSYNKIAFVAKTAKTLRSIAVEPLGNGYLQKGIDLAMRNRLKRVGIDLGDQSLNQRLAREGSVDDSAEGFCTIDLSSASDSVSTGLVKLLLPPAWFRLLDSVRSPSFLLPGAKESRRYEKFCSMGNGFCFPLESLIFASVCHAVTGGSPARDWAVYGDDIIVRRKAFDAVIAGLKHCGFKTNARKTFATGPFRESCGGNWYNGEDVTPFTLDFEFEDLGSMFKAINLCRRNARSSAYFAQAVAYLINAIPEPWRFFRPIRGPEDTAIDYGDLSFRKNWGWKRSFQCPVWYELKANPVKDTLLDPTAGWVVMAAALRGHYSEKPFVVRHSVETRVRSVAQSGSGNTEPDKIDPVIWVDLNFRRVVATHRHHR